MSQEAIAQAKATLRAELGRALYKKIEAIRVSREGMTFQSAFNELKKREPALFSYIDKVECGDWPRSGLATKAAKNVLPARHSKPEDDSQVYIVYAADGTVDHLELS